MHRLPNHKDSSLSRWLAIYHISAINVNPRHKTRRFSRCSRASGYRLSEAVDFEEWAATENPAAALLPPDSLIAHLPACRAADSDLTALTQGRTIDAGKLRFAENPLFDSQQIARIYRDDGLFLGAVKIENDTARALRLLP